MPLNAKALGEALDEDLTLHTTLCRRDAPAFQKASRNPDELVVACTQESRLFTELASETEGAVSLDVRPIRFVNIRETGGWGREAAKATPKMAALLALARLPDAEPVGTVGYQSAGRLLIIGPLEAAERAAAQVSDVLDVTLLATGGSGSQARRYPVLAGEVTSLRGWLGAFTLVRSTSNPIDLDLCTRCNACVAACPEGAIGLDYQIDMNRCRSHRACVTACEAVGAIQFGRDAQSHEDSFDLVLDLRETPAFSQHALPQGYVHLPAGLDSAPALGALIKLRDLVGEFEKPRFFNYKQKICAHGRNEQVGCNACVEICSASAITSDLKKNQIVVNPNLCVGCGACTTVCPTGALTYAYPRASEQGVKLRTLLATYQKAGGTDAALLLHSQEAGAALVNDLGRMAALDKAVRGMPAAGDPAAAVAHRLGRRGPLAHRVRLRCLAGLGAHDGRRSATVPRCGARADGGGPGHRQRAGLQRRTLPGDRGARCARAARPGRHPGRAACPRRGTGAPALRCKPKSAPRWSWRLTTWCRTARASPRARSRSLCRPLPRWARLRSTETPAPCA